MTLEEHLSRSRLVRCLRAGPLGDWIDLYTERLRRDRYSSAHAGSALHILILLADGWSIAMSILAPSMSHAPSSF
jgi:hypothetical protein